MSLVKSFVVVIIASILLAGCVKASSIYTTSQNSTSHNLNQQMINIVKKNKELIDYQLTKQRKPLIDRRQRWSYLLNRLDQS